jgi:hypothetical protein
MEVSKMYLVLTPAYGRDYKSMKAVKEDWAANKDFSIANPGYPSYINKQDADREGLSVQIRYNNNLKSIVIGG